MCKVKVMIWPEPDKTHKLDSVVLNLIKTIKTLQGGFNTWKPVCGIFAHWLASKVSYLVLLKTLLEVQNTFRFSLHFSSLGESQWLWTKTTRPEDEDIKDNMKIIHTFKCMSLPSLITQKIYVMLHVCCSVILLFFSMKWLGWIYTYT